jgi:HSP20 family protein
MDAWRAGHEFVVEFDLPGVDPDSIDLKVERNLLTVRAERHASTGEDVELVAAERPRGVFSRQVFLGDSLDTDAITASFHDGVLHLTLPVADKAKPRKIEISNHSEERQAISA